MPHVLCSQRSLRIGRLVILTAALAGMCGCSDVMPLVEALPGPPDALRLEKPLDQPGNVVERGLSACPKRIEAGEAVCVKQTLATAGTTVPELMALMPGCRAGLVCRYEYTTVDNIGFVSAIATKFVAHWRVEFDFRKPLGIAGLPVTVVTY